MSDNRLTEYNLRPKILANSFRMDNKEVKQNVISEKFCEAPMILEKIEEAAIQNIQFVQTIVEQISFYRWSHRLKTQLSLF